MNKEIKEKWLKALRSGEYKQGKGHLKRGDRFCCLGVLCDLYIKEHNSYAWWRETEEDDFIIEDVEGSSSRYAPIERIQKWAGLERRNVIIDEVMQLNDGIPGEPEGYYFNVIADAIEEMA